MYLHALATALPETTLTQRKCLDVIARSDAAARLSPRSRALVQAVLSKDNGIDRRHFALDDFDRLFDYTPDELNAAFRRAAPALAGRALGAALAKAGLRADGLDALVVCTCTGYLCPGLTSYVAEALGLRANVFLQDLVGLGCGAAVPALRATDAILTAQPGATVACVAVEVCSAAIYLDDDPGVLISACLFGDGAAATIWRATPPAHDGVPAPRCHGFNTLHLPGERDKLRFELRDGKLRNLLHKTVPELAAGAVARLFAAEPADAPSIGKIVAHAGGRDVIRAIETALPGRTLDATREVLRAHGNMSSPSVLFALEVALRDGPPPSGEDWWLVSFGAGFAAHCCRISAG